MALKTDQRFDLGRIQKDLGIKQKSIDNCPVKIDELEKIYLDYRDSYGQLEKIRTQVLSVLNEALAGKVHSIRCRIKDADHLIEKIIRNASAKPDKYRAINVNDYNKIITDLIGIRIIILDKRDWREIHDSLLQTFRNIPERYISSPKDIITNYDRYLEEATKKGDELKYSYHAEKPVVYITSEDDRNIYRDKDLKIDPSRSHYRSIHYIIRYGTVYLEIQVRTLFEEGWLEFDHRIKYPYDQNNKKKQEYAGVLSNLAIAADRLIAFYKETDFPSEIIDSNEEDSSDTDRDDGNGAVFDLEGKMRSLF